MQIEQQLLDSLMKCECAILATVLDGTCRGQRRVWSRGGIAGSLGMTWADRLADEIVSAIVPGNAWLRCRLTAQKETVSVMIECFFPPEELILFGGGHLAQALAGLARQLNYKVIVLEDRPMFANRQLFPEADRIICDTFKTALSSLSFGPWSYVVIMTRGHRHDLEILDELIEKELGYIGMISSKRRAAIVKQHFAGKGIAAEHINRVHMPIGLAIGARTPAEIAVSIAAELIKERYNKACGFSLSGLEHAGVMLIDSGISDYTPRENIEILGQIISRGRQQDTVLAVVAATAGSTPRKTGAKMLLLADGSTVGTVGGGCVEGEIRRRSYEVRDSKVPQLVTYVLDNDIAAQEGMVCGGQMEILLLPAGGN